MQAPKISLCYYPTAVVLIDDDRHFLEQFHARFTGRDNLPCYAYENPQKALHFINNEYKPDIFVNHCISNVEDVDSDHVSFDFDIKKMHQEIYNPNRFKEITAIVVDYAMPGLNGLDFCRQINDRFIKKLMLTGEAGKELAVEAFNENSIDRFIMKSAPNLVETLLNSIKEQQTRYFLQLSEIILNRVISTSTQELAFLEDSVFVQLFNNYCKTNNIVEYYLLDNQGGFLMLDIYGKPSWLAVANEEQMQTYLQLAEDDDASENIIQPLRNKSRIPFFYTDEDYSIRPAEWEKYMHTAQVIEGKQKYYYTFITDPNAYYYQANRVLSFHHFLENS